MIPGVNDSSAGRMLLISPEGSVSSCHCSLTLGFALESDPSVDTFPDVTASRGQGVGRSNSSLSNVRRDRVLDLDQRHEGLALCRVNRELSMSKAPVLLSLLPTFSPEARRPG
jgi:hypothetical protein